MKNLLTDILIDTVSDSLRILPFLFLACLLMEFLEHKTSARSRKIIKNSNTLGPLVGGLLGAFPQCGFSAAASNLYAGRVITVGTLFAVYLSTSDEMLPIFISEQVEFSLILKVIAIKIVIGIVIGFVIDLILRLLKPAANHADTEHIHELCEHEHCHCERGIFLPSIHHTLSILLFIFIVSLALNCVIGYWGEDKLSSLVLAQPLIAHLLSSLIGLVPNCAASVVITQLYLEGVISLGAMLSGLLTGAGVGLLILFRINRPLRQNFIILALLFAIGTISGVLIDLSGLFI